MTLGEAFGVGLLVGLCMGFLFAVLLSMKDWENADRNLEKDLNDDL